MFRPPTREDVLFDPLKSTGTRFYLFVAFLLAVIAWAAYAYFTQLSEGLVVTDRKSVV